jgi:hypothetical protein
MILLKIPGLVLANLWSKLRATPRLFPAQETGQRLAESFAAIRKALDLVEECISRAESNGYTVEGASDFRMAREQFISLVERFHEEWPMLDLKEAQAARSRIAAGQYGTLEDLSRAVDVRD